MAKARRLSTPQTAAVSAFPDLTGPSEFRTITSHIEKESEYKLDDLTTLRIRPVLIEARRLSGQWAPDGDHRLCYKNRLCDFDAGSCPSSQRSAGEKNTTG